MKRIPTFFLLLFLALPVAASPKDWVKHHKRFLLAAGAVAGASIVQYKATTYCSRGDVERCNEGYGSRRGFDWFSIGMSGAMLGAAEGCWKNDGGKFCYALTYGIPAAQVSFGIHDFLSYKPKEKNEKDNSRSRFTFGRLQRFAYYGPAARP